MQGIFISYRRQGSQSAAGRLPDHIKEHLADVPVFRDVETIEPGADFIEAINRALASCGVLLTLIYTVNGVQYAAELVISADGNWLQGRYASAITGERGMVALQRTQ